MRWPRQPLVALLLATAPACRGEPEPAPADPAPTTMPAPPPAAPELPWLKGQLHMHTGNSGDSTTPPADALRWYAAHGFDFVVFTDHNFVTVAPPDAPVLALPGVELTQNLDACDPPPEPGLACLLHVNALFVDPARAGRIQLPPATSDRRRDRFGRALQTTRELGGVAQLNHPNFHYAADAALLAALAGEGLALFELANESIDSNNAGDAAHPTTEAMWDDTLTRGAHVFAVATDDSHHYFDAAAVAARGEIAYTGDRGFIVVHATRDAAAIRAAVLRGDFYASTGPRLRALDRSAAAIELTTETPCDLEFIGAGGEVQRHVHGTHARMALSEARGPYLRARVRDGAGRLAWTQPIWRADRVDR
jgi:hypothetical protein